MNLLEIFLGDGHIEPSNRTLQTEKPARAQMTTDIAVWLNQAAPTNVEDLKDLRLTLCRERNIGAYSIDFYGKRGDLLLTGPESSLLIVSSKALHFLLRSLGCLRRRYGLRGF